MTWSGHKSIQTIGSPDNVICRGRFAPKNKHTLCHSKVIRTHHRRTDTQGDPEFLPHQLLKPLTIRSGKEFGAVFCDKTNIIPYVHTYISI